MTKQNGSYNNFSFSSTYAQSCSTGQFYNYSSSSCGECSEALNNCENCASSQMCTECSNSRLIIVNGSCVANCSEGFYPNPNITSNTTEMCFSCPLHCSQCDSQYYCYQCESPFQWNQSTGTCQNQSLVCPSGQFLNGTSQQCVNCSQAIQGCQLCSSNTNCTQCYSGLTLNYSVCTCPVGQYSNPNTTSSTLCLDCMEHCNKCYNGTGCSSCESSYTFNYTSGTCEHGCPPGQYYNSSQAICVSCMLNCLDCSNSTNCNECAQTYTWNTTSQSCQQQSTPTCQSGQYYNLTQAACASCMSNCLNCSNSTTCNQCASSYIWNATSLSCQQQSIPTCQSGQYYNSSQAICVSCMLNCLDCSNSTNCNQCASSYIWNATSLSCQQQSIPTCQSGQYYNSSQAICVSCMLNCLDCSNSTNCNQCASSYIWNATSLSCQQQSIPTCQSGQYYNSSQAACLSCMSNCLNCSNSTNCNQCALSYIWNATSLSCQQQSIPTCQSGQYYNSSQAICVSCMLNCLDCSNSTNCNQCASSYIWNATSLSCQQQSTPTCQSGQYYNSTQAACASCMSNCLNCSNSTTCNICASSYTWNATSQSCQIPTCQSGQYYNLTQAVCVNCMSNCLNCSNSTNCNQCASYYTWNASSQSCQSQITPTCVSGQYYNSTQAACLSCMSNCLDCSNSTNCNQCASSYIWNATSLSCQQQSTPTCQSGQYYNSSQAACLSCMSNCLNCSNSTNCNQCASSYIWNATSLSCQQQSIPTCQSGQYYNSSQAICVSCMLNCLDCSNSTNCNQCASSYIWNATSLSCQQQSIPTCQSGQYYNSSQAACLSCMSNCLNCSNSTNCNQCASSYIWNATSLSCQQQSIPTCQSGQYYNSSQAACLSCMSNCLNCSNSTNCNQCASSYIWNATSLSCQQQSIPTCQSGQYYNSSQAICVSCMLNCLDCSNSTNCNQCASSYIWNATSLSCQQQSIPTCQSGQYYNSSQAICVSCMLNCLDCSNSTNCNQCASSYIWNATSLSCQQQSIPTCQSGQYYNSSQAICVSCMLNCLDCSNSTNCNQCASSYIWNATSLSCQQQSTPTCQSGQYYNSTQAACASCMSNCLNCSNSTTCNICASSYTWNATSQSCQIPTCQSGQYYNLTQAVCVNCMSNCLNCSNSTNCNQCASYYTWNASSQSCQSQITPTCVSGQYYNSTQAACLSCMSNCLDCSNSTNCNQCASSYIWNATSLSCQQQSTPTCQSGQYYNSTQAACASCMSNCLNCSNFTTCNVCASSYTWNQTSQSCQQHITVTDLTDDVTYKSTGDYWNLTLQMKNQPQIYQLKVYQEYMPGSFYWAIGSVYPTVYVATNCTTQYSCSYSNSSEVSPTNYCVKTPNTNDTAWALTTDALSSSECIIQFYVAGNYQTNDTLNFMYFPQKEVQIGSNQEDFNWQPNLNRYFRYSFIANGTNSVNTFTIQTNNSLNGIYFGTSASAAQCNYPLPNKTSQCSNVLVNSSSSGMMYSLTFTSNAVIYFAISAGGNAYIPFVISTQGSQQHAYYNWDLTNLSTNWMSGNQVYWSLELNYTTNMKNNYQLKLNTDSWQRQTPGTIYIFYNLNNSLQTAYVSTNCSTVEVCNNQTDTPSADNYCWIAGQNSIWSMNTQETFGQCYFYFSIPELTVAPQANFAFLPQLNLSGTQNYTGLPIPWVFQTEQFFTYEIPATYQYYNETKGYFNVTISGLNTNFVKYMYFSTNDPYYNSSCNSNFPESGSSCFENASTYSVNNTNYLNYSFNVSLTSSKIVLGFLTQQYESIKYFDFSSNYTFGCRERYILNNGTCEREQTADLTNASTPVSNSTTPDKKYWNVTIDPTQSTEEEQFYTLELETVNFPGTFYLSSQFLETVYITTDCNSTMPCTKFTEFPEAQKYCFTQQSGNNGIFINSYEKDSSSNCQFDFTFQNNASSNGVVQMQYFPLQNFTDTNNLSIYIPSQTVAMPRFTQYTLPISKSAVVPAYFDYYTIKISNIPNALISDIYYSTDDSSSASTECKLTEFPDQNTICSFTKISQSTDLFEIEFNVASVSSHHYIAFYTKQADSEKYLNLVVSSTTQCQTGYYYSEASKKCEEQQTTCNEGQFYNTKTSECVLCSTALSYCSKCSSTGEYCTECNKGNGGQITLTNGHCLVTCQSGKYPNPNEAQTALCLDCMEHCVQCQNADSCTECYEPTFKWNDKTSTCDSVCDDGKYYDIKSNSCVNCEVSQCTVCYGAGKQCHSCSKGYKLEASGSNGNTCKKDAFKLQIGLAAFFLLLILFFKEY